LRSVINADLIIALDEGKVVETGTRAELLRRGGTYTRLFKVQARGLAPATDRGWPERAEIGNS